MLPKISVIVPVYKAEKYLHRCIDSILAQTFIDFELLLINDGSPDNSGAICDEYARKDSRISVFHKENGGVSSARNLGLDNAKGEWIAFVDADDWLKCKYLEKLAKQLDADMIKCDIEPTSNISSHKITENNKYDVKQFIEKKGKEFIARCVYATLFKTNIIREFNIHFNKQIRYGEDMIFNLQYLYHCQDIRLTNYTGYVYFSDTEIIYHNKYNLSFHEIEVALQKACEVKSALKEKTGANMDPYYDHYLYFSMIPITKLADQESMSEYFDLCKKFISSLDLKMLYNTSYFSPIIRGISELKLMYKKKLYANGKELYNALYCINSNCNVKISFPHKDFYIWNWLIKHKLFYILDLGLKFYFTLKRNFKNAFTTN